MSSLAELAGSVRKADDKKSRRRNYAVGGGTAAAGLGLVGGGIPGAKVNRLPIDMLRAKGAKKKTTEGARALRGGIFGARVNMHGVAMYDSPKMQYRTYPGKSAEQTFRRHAVKGLRAEEEKVIRHMKLGRKGSNALLLGGLGAAGYGLARNRFEKAEGRPHKQRAVGLGGGMVVGGLGASALLNQQGNKWLKSAKRDYDEAARLTPKVGGAAVTRTRSGRLATVKAQVKQADVKPSMLQGASEEAIKRSGMLRGRAGQSGYFGNVYRTNAKVMRRGVVPAGLWLMAANRKKARDAAQGKKLVRKASAEDIAEQANVARDKRYRRSYLERINPRSKTYVKRGTELERYARPALLGGAGLYAGTGLGALAGAATRRPKVARAGALAGGTAGSAMGATAGYTRNLQRGDTVSFHRKSGKKAKYKVSVRGFTQNVY